MLVLVAGHAVGGGLAWIERALDVGIELRLIDFPSGCDGFNRAVFCPITSQICDRPADFVSDLHARGMHWPRLAAGCQSRAQGAYETVPDMAGDRKIAVHDGLRHALIGQKVAARRHILALCLCPDTQ